MKTDTIESLIWIFAIIVFTGLTMKISSDSNDFSCDKCEVTLTNTMAGGQPYKLGTFKIEDLFEEYKDGHCVITWTSTGGYVYG